MNSERSLKVEAPEVPAAYPRPQLCPHCGAANSISVKSKGRPYEVNAGQKALVAISGIVSLAGILLGYVTHGSYQMALYLFLLGLAIAGVDAVWAVLSAIVFRLLNQNLITEAYFKCGNCRSHWESASRSDTPQSSESKSVTSREAESFSP